MSTIYPTNSNWLSIKDLVDLKGQVNNLTWSTAIKPLIPITVFGRVVEKFLIGNSGQLKFLPGDAKQWSWPWEKCKIPDSLNDLVEGYQIIPFGEAVIIKG